eukprot:tig00021070_g17940.t1
MFSGGNAADADASLDLLPTELSADDALFAGEIDPGRLEIYKDRRIGAGSFGNVYHGRYFGEDVAVKELAPAYADADGEALRKFRRELAIQYGLSRGDGPGPSRVVQLKGALTRKAPYRIVMELMEGSLFEMIISGRELDPPTRVQALLEVAQALEHMHGQARPVTHRDVKSKNILWRRTPDGGLSFKLSDFGESSHTLSITPGSSLHSAVGTAPWMSPEHMQGAKYSRACDVYSLGVVAWEVLTGRVPHGECSNILQIYAKVVERREGLQVPADAAPRQLADLAARCLAWDPAARPTAPQLLPEVAETAARAREAAAGGGGGGGWEAARAVAGGAFGTLRVTRHLWRPTREHPEWGRPFSPPCAPGPPPPPRRPFPRPLPAPPTAQDEAASRLAGAPPGTFVLRLAASEWPSPSCGAVAAVYVSAGGTVRHALLAGRTAADVHAEVQARPGTLRRPLGADRDVSDYAAARPKYVRAQASPPAVQPPAAGMQALAIS